MADSDEEKININHTPALDLPHIQVMHDQLLPVKTEPDPNAQDDVMDQVHEPRCIISEYWEEVKRNENLEEEGSFDFTFTMVSPKKIKIEPGDVTDDPEKKEFKDKFNLQLAEFYNQHQGSQKKPWTKERIIEVMDHLKNGKEAIMSKQRRTSMDYYWISKYDIMDSLHMEHLIFKRKTPDSPIVRIVPTSEYFDTLYEVHNLHGHGGRDKMLHVIRDKFYIQKKAVEIFVSLCPTCGTKRNGGKKSIASVQGPSHDFNSGGDLDFIDMRASADGVYNWLLVYQNKKTNFFHLRPLKTKLADEVALELTKIFLQFGPPQAMHSSDGRSFTDDVIKEIKNLWADCKIVVRNPKKVTVNDCKREISDMLRCWMKANGPNWAFGSYFVQNQKNTTVHRVLGKSPYCATFGSEPNCGLKRSNVSEEKT